MSQHTLVADLLVAFVVATVFVGIFGAGFRRLPFGQTSSRFARFG
ncbi:MAG: hypothetical protein V2I67_18685 [Thermoanaerobaculales bacterium]|nr:hypothetical protein [Thermoanaerobaculales bacterium]